MEREAPPHLRVPSFTSLPAPKSSPGAGHVQVGTSQPQVVSDHSHNANSVSVPCVSWHGILSSPPLGLQGALDPCTHPMMLVRGKEVPVLPLSKPTPE